MISDPMKRKMPTIGGAIRELKWIGGGCRFASPCPWSCPCASAAALIARSFGCHHVIDGQSGLGPEPLEQVAAQPARARLRERRDDDLVDPLVVRRRQRRRDRIGLDNLAVRVDALDAK